MAFSFFLHDSWGRHRSAEMGKNQPISTVFASFTSPARTTGATSNTTIYRIGDIEIHPRPRRVTAQIAPILIFWNYPSRANDVDGLCFDGYLRDRTF
jgi:hypothetical protein